MLWAHGGWNSLCAAGAALSVLAFAVWFTGRRSLRAVTATQPRPPPHTARKERHADDDTGPDGPEVGVLGLGRMGMSYAYDTTAPPRRGHLHIGDPPGPGPGHDPDRHRGRVRAVHQRGKTSVRALSRRYGVHRRLVRGALSSPVPTPRRRPVRTSPRMEPYKKTVDAWLRADPEAPRKQRHTVRRIVARIEEVFSEAIPYPTVRDFVAARRKEIGAQAGAPVEAFVTAKRPTPTELTKTSVRDRRLGGIAVQPVRYERRQRSRSTTCRPRRPAPVDGSVNRSIRRCPRSRSVGRRRAGRRFGASSSGAVPGAGSSPRHIRGSP